MHFVSEPLKFMVLNQNNMTLEVMYATEEKQCCLIVAVPENSTIQFAIEQSGILNIFPEIDLTQQAVGIFSVIKKLTDIVKKGDRVEIYRPLLVDPKERRRERARKFL